MKTLPALMLLALVLPSVPPRVIAGTVTNCDDASLRAALVGGGTVSFACDGTIVLTNTLIIGSNTVLDGTGHHVMISGGNSVRVFFINPGVKFSMIGLTVANGASASGAGLLNYGQILLLNCTFSNNVTTVSGGGVY